MHYFLFTKNKVKFPRKIKKNWFWLKVIKVAGVRHLSIWGCGKIDLWKRSDYAWAGAQPEWICKLWTISLVQQKKISYVSSRSEDW